MFMHVIFITKNSHPTTSSSFQHNPGRGEGPAGGETPDGDEEAGHGLLGLWGSG